MSERHRVRVSIYLTVDQVHAYYAGAVKNVAAKTVDGRVIHFPANILRSVVDKNGVNGMFDIEFDQNHKFVAIHRVA